MLTTVVFILTAERRITYFESKDVLYLISIRTAQREYLRLYGFMHNFTVRSVCALLVAGN